MEEVLEPDGIEDLLEETGAVPVEIGGAQTFGHDQLSDEQLLELRKAGGAKDGVVIPTGKLASTPVDGMPITVDGASALVTGHRRISDGRLTLIGFGAWSHTVDIYEHGTVSGDRGQQEPGFSLLEQGVGLELRARGGDVEDREFGMEATGEWEGRIDPGATVEAGYGLKLTAGKGPPRFEVTFVGERTDNWRIPIVLEESEESF